MMLGGGRVSGTLGKGRGMGRVKDGIFERLLFLRDFVWWRVRVVWEGREDVLGDRVQESPRWRNPGENE